MEAPGKPLTGVILGLVSGVFVAVIVQQAGIWPLDRLLLFGAMGVMAIVGMLLTRGLSGGGATKVISIIIIVAVVGFGASGAAAAGESGFISDECSVSAYSDIDAISSPAATSKSNPFDVDPAGIIGWDARSDNVIQNHTWDIWIDVGGFPLPAASGGDDNEGESQREEGEREIATYVEDIAFILGTDDVAGIYEVGGGIAGDGGSCDGLAFVRIPADPFEGPVALASTIIVVIIIIIEILVGRTVRRRFNLTADGGPGLDADPEIFTDGFESGDTSSWGDAK